MEELKMQKSKHITKLLTVLHGRRKVGRKGGRHHRAHCDNYSADRHSEPRRDGDNADAVYRKIRIA
jgi:hypothetical protein